MSETRLAWTKSNTQDVPCYWKHESSGVLRPAVMAYLTGDPLTEHHLRTLRRYFEAWLQFPWQGAAIDDLRREIPKLCDRKAIRNWLNELDALGIDPL